jgi:hypothetical protein
MMSKLAPPLESLDPTDWRMYCDLLQDAGASERRWTFALRVADSLESNSDLVLVLRCGPSALERHWLRVGRGWFIPTQLTSISHYRSGFAWWRKEWVLSGMARYPYARDVYGDRDEAKLIHFASGTPWSHKHSAFAEFCRYWGPQMVRKQFFRGHGLLRKPANSR